MSINLIFLDVIYGRILNKHVLLKRSGFSLKISGRKSEIAKIVTFVFIGLVRIEPPRSAYYQAMIKSVRQGI